MREISMVEVEQVEGGIIQALAAIAGIIATAVALYELFSGGDEKQNGTVEVGDLKIVSDDCIRARVIEADGKQTNVEVNCPPVPASAPGG